MSCCMSGINDGRGDILLTKGGNKQKSSINNNVVSFLK